MPDDSDPCPHEFRAGECRWCGQLKSQPPSVVTAEPERTYQTGPALSKLSVIEQEFVGALMEMANPSYTDALANTSWSSPTNSKHSLRSAASKMGRDPRIQAAIQEEAQRRLSGTGLAAAIETVAQIMADPETPAGVRLKAAEIVLNRTGLHAKTEHKVTVVQMTDEEKAHKIYLLATEQGLDPKKLLGHDYKPPVIDADFEEVK